MAAGSTESLGSLGFEGRAELELRGGGDDGGYASCSRGNTPFEEHAWEREPGRAGSRKDIAQESDSESGYVASGSRRDSLQDEACGAAEESKEAPGSPAPDLGSQRAGRPGEAGADRRAPPEEPAGAEAAESLLPAGAHDKQSFLQNFKSPEGKYNYSYIVTIILLVLITLGLTIALVKKDTSPQGCNNCLKGWMGYDGRCYYFSNVSRNWNESLEFCSSFDASLVIIKTKSDLEIINRYKENFYYWIGLTKGAEGWRWLDGSPFTNDIITLENEAPNLNCGYLNTEKIVTIACESLRRWICIRDVNPTFGPS